MTSSPKPISRLLFEDDLVLLASSESGLQHALGGFLEACNIAGMKISPSKTGALHLLKNPVQCSLKTLGADSQVIEGETKN